jgi:lysozyme
MAIRKTRLAGAVLALAVATVGTFEGVRLVAYPDRLAYGIPTVCFGETRGVKLGDKHTLDECRAMLGDALVEFEQGIRSCLKNPDAIPDETYVAALSLSYNIGQAAFCGSTVRKRLDAGQIAAACDAFLAWNRAGGKVVQGLVNRRKEERALCLKGIQP